MKKVVVDASVCLKWVFEEEGSEKARNLLTLSEMISTHDLLLKSLENCHKYRISAYDSAYITLAVENKIILVSADEKLVQKVNDPNVIMTLTRFSRVA